MSDMGKLLSTTEVAVRLGITVPRIQTFIWEGRLPAQKIGRSYAIDEDDLKLVENRKPGRPKKRLKIGQTKTPKDKKVRNSS